MSLPQKKGEPVIVSRDEHPRATSLEALARLRGIVSDEGSVTAGNASGVNDGACALLLASGARLVTTAINQLQRVNGGRGGRYALCTMCIGVGQGIALVVGRV